MFTPSHVSIAHQAHVIALCYTPHAVATMLEIHGQVERPIMWAHQCHPLVAIAVRKTLRPETAHVPYGM